MRRKKLVLVLGFLAVVITVAAFILVMRRLQKDADNKRKMVTVNLLEAGQGEKRRLFYRPRNGTRSTLVLTFDLCLGLDRMNVAVPLRMVMLVTVTDVAKNGDISYDFDLRSAEILEEKPAPLPIRLLSEIQGLSGTALVSSCGVMERANVTTPETATFPLEEIVQYLEQLTMPLPEEPIGRGAKWAVVRSIKRFGIDVREKRSYELVSVDGPEVEIRFRIEEKAESKEFKPALSFPDATGKIVSFESSGKGKMKVDLENLVPESFKVDMQNNAIIEVQSAGEMWETKTTTSTRVDMES